MLLPDLLRFVGRVTDPCNGDPSKVVKDVGFRSLDFPLEPVGEFLPVKGTGSGSLVVGFGLELDSPGSGLSSLSLSSLSWSSSSSSSRSFSSMYWIYSLSSAS